MKTLAQVIEDHIRKALEKYKSQAEAAKVLGISTRTIRNYLTKWYGPRGRDNCNYRDLTPEERDRYESRNKW
jgi:predicted transcriptional regulator